MIHRDIKTLDDITPNISKYIPEDNAVLFLSEEEYNESKISFQNHKIFCHQTGCYGSFEIMDCYNSNECYSESALKYKKLTIFLQHITQETIQKANEVAKELKAKYGVDEDNLFGLHSFINLENWVILEQLSDFGRNILDKMSLNEGREETPQFNEIRYINKIITTNSTGILEPQNSDRLQVIDCFDIFQEHLKGNN